MNFREESLSVGSRGLDVLRMQYYLRVIAEVDKAIPQTAIDGVFDVDTRDAVTEFQRLLRAYDHRSDRQNDVG